jgi:hypothetical protein
MNFPNRHGSKSILASNQLLFPLRKLLWDLCEDNAYQVASESVKYWINIFVLPVRTFS